MNFERSINLTKKNVLKKRDDVNVCSWHMH